jgi:tetratricopeptide (TPR) repeat protein
MSFSRFRSAGWLACALAGGLQSACVTGTSVLADRCAASDDGTPTQSEIEACAALETNPELDQETLVAARYRQAAAYYELGDYARSMAVYEEIEMLPGTAAEVWYGRAQTEAALGRETDARRDAQSGMDHDPRVIRLLRVPYEAGELADVDNAGFYQEVFEPSLNWVPEMMSDLLIFSYERDIPDSIRTGLRQRALAFTGDYRGVPNGRRDTQTIAAVDACIAAACWNKFTGNM